MANLPADNPIFDAYKSSYEGFSWRWRWSSYWRDTFNRVVRPAMGFEPADRYNTQLPNVAYDHTALISIGALRVKWVLFSKDAEVLPAQKKGKARRPWNSSTHRVYLECPCGRLIPAGRVHQHRC